MEETEELKSRQEHNRRQRLTTAEENKPVINQANKSGLLGPFKALTDSVHFRSLRAYETLEYNIFSLQPLAKHREVFRPREEVVSLPKNVHKFGS